MSYIVDRIQVLVIVMTLLPLAGAVLNGLLGRRFPRSLVTAIACGMPLGSLLCALAAFRSATRLIHPVDREIDVALFTWLQADAAGIPLDISLGFLFDPLSAVLVLVVTGVGFLIHVYSVGYMANDPGYRRFFACMNLFLFSMLVLVLADSLALMFVGWEGVGLCSYLLIGFWHEDPAKASAGMKAFVVNRVGDVGFVIGMLAYFAAFGTLGIAGEGRATVVRLLPDTAASARVAIALLLFAGAVGKSAQIPLHVWLPDAMAGPTPVSALIHAATMVTAGVYLVARLNFLYVYAPSAGMVIAVVGTVTALVAGLAALAQRDIKRVLAYSTISQLGFMFLAAGLGAYAAAIFHLVTHAFFKALLFLGAGALIHALHGEQDLFRMGGLHRSLRAVFWPFLVGALALAGIFPLSGFWSKDEILLSALEHGHPILWGMGLAAAAITAFYSARLVVLAFLNRPGGAESSGHVASLHRPGLSMTLPLAVLAVFTFAAGLLGLPRSHVIEDFLRPVWLVSAPAMTERDALAPLLAPGLINALIALLLSVTAGGLGWYLYATGSGTLRKWLVRRPRGIRLHAWAQAGFGIDALYERLGVRPLRVSAFLLWLGLDVLLVDMGLVAGTGAMVRRMSDAIRRLQSGLVTHYAVVTAVGAILLIGLMLERAAAGWLFGM